MDAALMLPSRPDERWELAKQLGVDTAVVRFWDHNGDWWDYQTLMQTTSRFADHGFSLDVVEDRPPMERTVLGKDGRDEEIATVKQLLRNMGKLGIDVYSWVWTELPLGVLRTSDSLPGRGGSQRIAYDHTWMEQVDDHPEAGISESELWGNLEYFLDEVVPVAEEAGVKLALHPDDPPLSPIRGLPRIVTSLDDYERILDLYDSPNHGVTFCQGNFAAMEADLETAIERLGENIHFVHFRDVEGTPESFAETWHDNGPTDMLSALQTYADVGFDGPMRPDHVPRMVGEEDRVETQAGYTDMARLFAVGYMKGLFEAVDAPGTHS
ncbi:MAG: mannonate dehydratase [Halorhabdus sp.]